MLGTYDEILASYSQALFIDLYVSLLQTNPMLTRLVLEDI
jgi:hypothetical protein